MTYCFAWKYQDAVFLIADTLVTQGAPSDRPATSMAEPHRQLSQNEFVEERLLKLREVTEGIAVAIAGDVRFAFEIVDFMREHFSDVENVADLFLMVERSFGPFDPARHVQILVVEAVEYDACAITKWDSQSGCEVAPHCAYIGSLAQRYADVIAGLVLRLQADQPSKEAMLCSGIALVESLSQREDLIAQNVGGVICGLRVQRNTTIWPDDLITVLYKDDRSLDGMISMHVREGNVCVNSTYHGTEGSVFVNKSATAHTVGEIQAWSERWLPYLMNYLSEHFTSCTRWVFINRDRLVAVVFVVHARLEQADQDLCITKSGSGTVNFEFGPRLADALWRESPIYPSLRIVEAIDFAAALPDGILGAH